MSWDLLKRFIESDVFNQNPFLSVAYLSRYADHVGIHYVLCSKLRQFSYEEIEFFLPQLCHLIISVDNESMALEEFILDLCEESVNAALLTFWLFQTYLHDLSANPQSHQFKTCRRLYNKVQHIVFGLSEPGRNEKIKENVLPVTVLASFVLASAAVPFLPRWAGPLAIAQARKPQSTGDVISDAQQMQKIPRSQTMTPGSTRTKRAKNRIASSPNKGSSPDSPRPPTPPRPQSSESARKPGVEIRRPSHLELKMADARLSSSSLPLPNMKSPRMVSRPNTPATATFAPRSDETSSKRYSHMIRPLTPSSLSPAQKVKLLRQNYFRCETQFLTALEDISNRLVIVPKAARLSALRAELALIAQDLPAEVDIPVICPASLVDGIPSKSKHHRIVRLNPAEATVLNSAEKVPYLLMVEVLRDDFSFDPESGDNETLLVRLLSEQGAGRKRIFDLSDAMRTPNTARSPEPTQDSVFEPVSGDLGTSPLIQAEPIYPTKENVPTILPPKLSSGGATISSFSGLATPRTSGASTSRSNSPGPLRKMTIPTSGRSPAADQPDFSALATHMRTASQMLAQLESTSGKRPRSEVAAIRAKIIASMQSLEEQSFESDDGSQTPTFEIIMANANAVAANVGPDDIEGESPAADATLNPGAGAARMENDQKTGGVQRKGDRDDPSAATFGEAWHMKKERIRKSSPYGWMKNWDVLSVIVKTGADLRQEAFACQLILVCDKIWQDAGTPVWVKRMRILVTGESSGLIETITNGVSLHSLKRSLTLATIEAGKNPRGRIATLKDHFVKTFGPTDSDAYKAAEDAFKRSLAAYSIVSYILQLKDRHNGNVLIDNEGHIIHIDFGFMLSNSPGSVGFEAAPFKLTQDYVDVLGGVGSTGFDDYKKLCKQAFQALRRNADNLIDLVNMMGKESKMPCFSYGVQQATNSLRQRFQLQLSADEAEQFVETDLIGKSLGSYYTRLYDTFQYRTQDHNPWLARRYCRIEGAKKLIVKNIMASAGGAPRRHEWTKFEEHTLLCLMAKGLHLAAPAKKTDLESATRQHAYLNVATLLNAAVHGENFKQDIDKREVARKIDEVLQQRKGVVGKGGLLERQKVGRVTRTLRMLWERAPGIDYNGSIGEWNAGRQEVEKGKREEAERREKERSIGRERVRIGLRPLGGLREEIAVGVEEGEVDEEEYEPTFEAHSTRPTHGYTSNYQPDLERDLWAEASSAAAEDSAWRHGLPPRISEDTVNRTTPPPSSSAATNEEDPYTHPISTTAHERFLTRQKQRSTALELIPSSSGSEFSGLNRNSSTSGNTMDSSSAVKLSAAPLSDIQVHGNEIQGIRARKSRSQSPSEQLIAALDGAENIVHRSGNGVGDEDVAGDETINPARRAMLASSQDREMEIDEADVNGSEGMKRRKDIGPNANLETLPFNRLERLRE